MKTINYYLLCFFIGFFSIFLTKYIFNIEDYENYSIIIIIIGIIVLSFIKFKNK